MNHSFYTVCASCYEHEATLMRRGGFVWNPICAECAEWHPPHRIEPLDLAEIDPEWLGPENIALRNALLGGSK